MTLQHKIFQSRINGLKEQLGGAGAGAVNVSQVDPSAPQQVGGGFGQRTRDPRNQERMTTRALSGHPWWVGPPPFIVDPAWEAQYDKFVYSQDTTGGIPDRWPDGSAAGFPPPMISNPAALQYWDINGWENPVGNPDGEGPGGLNQDSWGFWWSFLSWFVGGDADGNGIPDFGTPYDRLMVSQGLSAEWSTSDQNGDVNTAHLMQQAAFGDTWAINFLLGQELCDGCGYGDDEDNVHMHTWFGSLFWGDDFEGNPLWHRYWENQ